MRAQIHASVLSHAYRTRNLEHQPQLLSSSGKFNLALFDACNDGSGEPGWLTAQVSYRPSHLPGLAALLRVEWSVAPTGDARIDLEKGFRGPARLEGKGRIRYSGALESDISLAAISVLDGGTVLNVCPSTGRIEIDEDTLNFDWNTARISYRGDGSATELDGLRVQLDLSSVRRGLGSFSTSMANFSNSLASAEGLQLAMQAIENGDKLDLRLSPAIRMLKAGDRQFDNLLLDMAVVGMDIKSVEFLINLAKRSCNFRNLTRQESQLMRDNLRRLLFRGLSAGIEKIGGRFNGAEMSGRLMVALNETSEKTFALEKALKIDGELGIGGKHFNADDREILVAMGFVPQAQGGMKASLEYGTGIVRLNGKAFDSDALFQLLKSTNEFINAFMNGSSLPNRPAALQDDAPAANESTIYPTDRDA